MRKVLFRIHGGLGKNIMGTAVVKAHKQAFPDDIIHVIASYPEAFANLPYVDKFFPSQPIPYFYDEHKDFEFFEFEPYLDLGYRKGEKHLIQAWQDGIQKSTIPTVFPEIILDDAERQIANNLLPSKIDRPLVAFQYVGGTSYYSPHLANDLTRPRHCRDLPFETAQQIVDKLVEKGFAVLHIGLPSERRLSNTLFLSDREVLNPRIVFALLDRCTYGLFIDSFAQHAWKALGRSEAIVMWGGTNPKTLGYESNINIVTNNCDTPFCNRPDTHLYDFQGNGNVWKCKHGGKCMNFNPEVVVEKLESINKLGNCKTCG